MSVLRNVGVGRDADGYVGELLEDSTTGARYIAYTPETYAQRVADQEGRIAEALEAERTRRRRRVRTLHAESIDTSAAD